MDRLCRQLGGYRDLADPGCDRGIPRRGVYFFFDDKEPRSGGPGPRIVRVGTHAVSASSKSTLWGRLRQHRGTVGGRHPGGGDHRGSVFRLHVGEALLARGVYPDSIADAWPKSSATPGVRNVEYPLERDVSEYIRRLPFLWVNIDDPPSKESARATVERTSIGLLSCPATVAADPPTASWLGHHAARSSIRASGLWNVDYVGLRHDPAGLAGLAAAVEGSRA